MGWEDSGGEMMPISTEDEIAPEDIVTLVSCNCNGECSNNHCTCKKNNVACTDFCGCGDSCQNTDMRPNFGDEDDLDDGETVISQDDDELKYVLKCVRLIARFDISLSIQVELILLLQ